MYAPPLSEFLWLPAATATAGSAPWPLMLWFESAVTAPAVLSIAPRYPLISPDRPGMFSGPRHPNLSTTIR